MCGRYGRRGDKQTIAEAFQVSHGLDEIYESDDCAPGSFQPAIRMDEVGDSELIQMRWGFKLPARLLFNARAEGLATSDFWKKMMAEHRCIVPASSFFEWKEVRKGVKDKYEITLPGRSLFGMAGLWSHWKNPKTGDWEKTFAVITSDPTSKMRTFHDRQPVILEPGDFGAWLAPSERSPAHLMRILDDDNMDIRRLDSPSIKPEATMRRLFD